MSEKESFPMSRGQTFREMNSPEHDKSAFQNSRDVVAVLLGEWTVKEDDTIVRRWCKSDVDSDVASEGDERGELHV